MLDNEGQEMLDREMLAGPANSSSSSRSGSGGGKVLVRAAVEEVAKESGKFAAPSADDALLSQLDGKDDINIVAKVSPELQMLELAVPTDVIVVDTVCHSPTEAVVTAVAAVFSCAAISDILDPPTDNNGPALAEAPEDGGDNSGDGDIGPNNTREAAAGWRDRRPGSGSDTASEYIEAS